MTFLMYDAEIINCVPPKDHRDFRPGFRYCKGWDDHAGMGISTIGFILTDDINSFQVHSIDNVESLIPFKTASFQSMIDNSTCVIGYNTRRFDDILLRANGYQIETHFDLLEHIRIAAFGSADWRDQPQGHSYKLGDIGAANGFPKTDSGAFAPEKWQKGKKTEVIEYCKNDVAVMAHVLNLAIRGQLLDPNTGELLRIATPTPSDQLDLVM